jgi:hypothetical protein
LQDSKCQPRALHTRSSASKAKSLFIGPAVYAAAGCKAGSCAVRVCWRVSAPGIQDRGCIVRGCGCRWHAGLAGATHFSSLITGPISSSFLAGSVPFLKVSFLHATRQKLLSTCSACACTCCQCCMLGKCHRPCCGADGPQRSTTVPAACFITAAGSQPWLHRLLLLQAVTGVRTCSAHHLLSSLCALQCLPKSPLA